MNKHVLVLLWLVAGAVVAFSGCEVQGPVVSTDPSHAELEDSVSAFAVSIDPYENYSRNEIYAMLEEFMYAHPDVYGAGFAVSGPGHNLKDFYYIYKDGTTYITYDGFDYATVDEEAAKSLLERVAVGEQFWSGQYSREDSSGNTVTVSTFFTPIVNDSGNVKYVLTVDQIEETE